MALRPAGIAEKEPVREFTGDHHTLARTLLQILQAQRTGMVEALAKAGVEGGFIKTFDDYRFKCGQIDGLDIAINFCKEAQRKLEA